MTAIAVLADVTFEILVTANGLLPTGAVRGSKAFSSFTIQPNLIHTVMPAIAVVVRLLFGPPWTAPGSERVARRRTSELK